MVTARALQVFVRNPVPGSVKTRLIPALGADGATRIYRHLLDHALDAAVACSADVTVWVDGTPIADDLRTRLEHRGLASAVQCPGDLGVRMQHAIGEGLRRAERVVLIGSDCPEYSAAFIDAAFAALDERDVVVGPAVDGGYVLIGARGPCPALFDDMPWSTPHLLAATRARIARLGLRHAELAPLRDIDDVDDLAWFPALHAGS